ncbi:hypothetical protein BHQ23_08025 [Mycobacterium gordonae]|uniref:Uncharacterized protein n=1 Tax=Mycobacterium gordonae TaxID=1778 RepID=A0A1X1WYX2_MYCGO|nr:hypothetical protein BHQ23_08025 [Mycobacterium gordonae]ORV91835.1 hypothetical protein AWC08_20220 [Mycobacterium gordonae]
MIEPSGIRVPRPRRRQAAAAPHHRGPLLGQRLGRHRDSPAVPDHRLPGQQPAQQSQLLVGQPAAVTQIQAEDLVLLGPVTQRL